MQYNLLTKPLTVIRHEFLKKICNFWAFCGTNQNCSLFWVDSTNGVSLTNNSRQENVFLLDTQKFHTSQFKIYVFLQIIYPPPTPHLIYIYAFSRGFYPLTFRIFTGIFQILLNYPNKLHLDITLS